VTRGSRIALLEQDVLWDDDTATVLDAVIAADTSLLAVRKELEQLESRLREEPTDTELMRYGELQDTFHKLGGYAAKHRAERCLTGLGIEQRLWSHSASTLSGGQQRRVALAQVLVQNPEILLLDEPTNYLDIWARGFLEDLLIRHAGAVLVISHDPYFLDSVATHIAELEDHALFLYPGDYTSFLAQREERRKKAAVAHQQQEDEKAKLKEYIRRNIAGQKHAQAVSRRRKLEKLESAPVPLLGPKQRNLKLRLEKSRREGRIVLKTENLEINRGNKILLREFTLRLERGERLAIVGPNGSGKTSLLLTLLGQLPPSSGRVVWGHNVDIAYLQQECEPDELGATPFEAVGVSRPDWTAGEIRSYLARFLFFGDTVFQAVRSLSGGERSRLALACLLASSANVLVLDEPTNHLDLDSRNALEAAFLEYLGTVVIVTHDRHLINRFAHRVVVIQDARATLVSPPFERIWSGTYGESRARVPEQKKPSPSRTPRKRRRSAEVIEREIAALEEQVEELKLKQSDPELTGEWEQVVKLFRQQESLEQRIEALIVEWEQAASP
jgi:ATP-binding cassette subfamily F protein 3